MWQHGAHLRRSPPHRGAQYQPRVTITRLLVILVGATGCFGPSCFTSALDTAGWKQRTIYQVITDRFALANGDRDTCNEGNCPYGNYCGGTFQGLSQKLPYITGMGFDAIWISPVVDNIECGYHGYWAQKKFEIESHFGGADGLQELMNACKTAGIAVMLDIVGNHMGPPSQATSFSEFSPFNDTSHYHGTLASHCSATDGGISQQQREVCWLANLGDLKQENPFVTDQLVKWMMGLQQQYQFDGIRIDTVPYVPKTFWKALKTRALPNTYAVGECLVPISLQDIAGYQQSSSEGVNGPLLDGVLNYPLFTALRNAFQQGGSLQNLRDGWLQINSTFFDSGALGNFAENHDQPRWLLGNKDVTTYQNAMVVAFFLPGVPIAYYGTEQGMAGGQSDNDKRQPQWQHGGYDTGSPLYSWTARLVSARKAMLRSLTSQSVDSVSHLSVTADGNVFSFVRGSALVVSCRQGYDGTAVVPTPWPRGTQGCDLLETNTTVAATKDLAPPTCDARADRLDCGHEGTQKPDCESAGCCWSPVSPNPTNKPWCFHPNGGPPPPPPPLPTRCVTVAHDGSVVARMTAGSPRVFVMTNNIE